jgi:hypothetical protein
MVQVSAAYQGTSGLSSAISRASFVTPHSNKNQIIFSSSTRHHHRHLTSSSNAKPSSKSSLSMHMGHSHSHHHHHHHDHKTEKTVPLDPSAVASKRLRRAASLLFCAVATLGSRLGRRKAIRQADIAAFVISSVVLASADTIRREIVTIVQKVKKLRDGFIKHSNFEWNSKNPLDYFFRNKNEADRVTWIGVIVNLILSAGKFVVGVTCHSSALIADAGKLVL